MCPNFGTAGTGPKRVQAGRAMEIEGDHQLQSITASRHARVAAGRLADPAELGSSIPCSQVSSGPGPRPRPLANQSVSQTRPETTHPLSAAIRYHPSHPTTPHSSWLSQLACLHTMIDRSAGLEWRSAETGRLVSGEGEGEGGPNAFWPSISEYVLHRGVACMCVCIIMACELFGF